MNFANAVAVSRYGEVVKVFRQVSENFINANVGENEYIIQKENPGVPSYWDFDIDDFVPLPKAPTSWCVFDYASRQWVDQRTLSEARIAHWEALKVQRDDLEYAGFAFNGLVYDSDMKSQGRISAAASLGVSVEWTLQDNSTVWMEPDDLKRLVSALAMHITQVHARGKAAREAIEAATTIEQVESITL